MKKQVRFVLNQCVRVLNPLRTVGASRDHRSPARERNSETFLTGPTEAEAPERPSSDLTPFLHAVNLQKTYAKEGGKPEELVKTEGFPLAPLPRKEDRAGGGTGARRYR